MFSLRRDRNDHARSDPAPSRWAWRMQRLMLTPAFRFGLRVGVPFCVTLLAGTVYLADPDRRAAIAEGVADARASIEERPEFMVKLMAIDGASGTLAADIRTAVPLDFPQSSFDLDLTAIRKQIKTLNGVKSVNVRIRPGGVLQVDITPRVPVAIWRNEDGLVLVDAAGAHVSAIAARAEFPGLPLIAGEGAARHVPEALALHQTAAVLGDRLKGVVRMGNRRWDIVLDREQRILLPEEKAMQALERVIALEKAEHVLSRDVARVDLRLAHRPTVRMTKDATEAWWDIKQGTED
ncbi:cell division protein FtsQ/DivIB [Sulfitobacter aestuariivivens]|uniref:Cell division protein FtsQ n=1 Tax=Sulfitobacter aestuariivivens TaxID=2766981 RepID=A0A927D5J3_9RHOB|nr:cell division protein FtsQ/DivIB [Sulfitobacter aestuariivivens]MBD3663642.1 cell division protein FtsQ/DivIB [Sulfitobacter aestuariivivens]